MPSHFHPMKMAGKREVEISNKANSCLLIYNISMTTPSLKKYCLLGYQILSKKHFKWRFSEKLYRLSNAD